MDLMEIGVLVLASATVVLFIVQIVILIYVCRLKKTVERGLMGHMTSEIRKRRWKDIYNSTDANRNGLSTISEGAFSNPIIDMDTDALSSKTNSIRSDGLVEAFRNGLNKKKDIRDGTSKTPKIR